MATKKQKRAAAEARREQYMADLAAENALVLKDAQEKREKEAREAKIKASKALLAKHEAEKAGKTDKQQKLSVGKAMREAGLTPKDVQDALEGDSDEQHHCMD